MSTPDFSDSAPDFSDAPLPSASSPITPPQMAPPKIAMHQVYLGSLGVPTDESGTVQRPDSPENPVKGFLRNAYQVSTPGIAVSLLQKKFPGLAGKIPGNFPFSGPPIGPTLERNATSVGDLPRQLVENFALSSIPEWGSARPAPEVRPVPPVQDIAPAPSGPSLGSLAARHIPIVGKILRTMDDVQALLGKDAPATPTNVAPAKAPVPETNGIQWGTGGQGPLDLRGKRIPAQSTPQDIPLTGAKSNAVQGLDPYSLPRTPPMEQAQSTTIAKHGYHGDSQTMVVEFKNGRVYEYRGVPQKVYSQYQQSESQGSFFANNIKGRYQTSLRGTVKPTPGQQVSSALGSR